MIVILLFEFLGLGLFSGAVNILESVADNQLIYLCLIFMAVLVVCTPISGGHLNPAITFGVWITCDNKKQKVGKMIAMIFA